MATETKYFERWRITFKQRHGIISKWISKLINLKTEH